MLTLSVAAEEVCIGNAIIISPDVGFIWFENDEENTGKFEGAETLTEKFSGNPRATPWLYLGVILM